MYFYKSIYTISTIGKDQGDPVFQSFYILLMIEVIKVWRPVRSNVTFFVPFVYQPKEDQLHREIPYVRPGQYTQPMERCAARNP